MSDFNRIGTRRTQGSRIRRGAKKKDQGTSKARGKTSQGREVSIKTGEGENLKAPNTQAHHERSDTTIKERKASAPKGRAALKGSIPSKDEHVLMHFNNLKALLPNPTVNDKDKATFKRVLHDLQSALELGGEKETKSREKISIFLGEQLMEESISLDVKKLLLETVFGATSSKTWGALSARLYQIITKD